MQSVPVSWQEPLPSQEDVRGRGVGEQGLKPTKVPISPQGLFEGQSSRQKSSASTPELS